MTSWRCHWNDSYTWESSPNIPHGFRLYFRLLNCYNFARHSDRCRVYFTLAPLWGGWGLGSVSLALLVCRVVSRLYVNSMPMIHLGPRVYFAPAPLWDGWGLIEVSRRKCMGSTWSARVYSTWDLDSNQHIATIHRMLEVAPSFHKCRN